MNIDHAALAVGGNEDKTIVLARLTADGWAQAESCAENRRIVSTADQVELLLRSDLIDLLKPVVDRHYGAVRPDGPVKGAAGDFLAPGIGWRCPDLAQAGRRPQGTISAYRTSSFW